LQEKQDAAVKDFAHIFIVEKDPKKAWDKYVPGCGSLKFGPLSATDAMPFSGSTSSTTRTAYRVVRTPSLSSQASSKLQV
jgi:hypothetical protein